MKTQQPNPTISPKIQQGQFQAMVVHIVSPHTLTFTRTDDSSMQQLHNAPLHIEVLVDRVKIK